MQVVRLAEGPVEVDLNGRAALVFRRLVGVLDTVGVGGLDLVAVLIDLPPANPVALGEGGVERQRREVDDDGKLLDRTVVGETERNIQITRGHEGAFQVLALLLRTRYIAVHELAAEFEDRTVGPVLRHLEGRGDRNVEFVLVLEPDAVAVGRTVVVGRLDPHPVVAHLGVENRLYREEILREGMLQEKRRRQRDGVVTARHGDPRIVVRGERSLQVGLYLQVVALLPDRRPLGLVTGQAEIIDFSRSRKVTPSCSAFTSSIEICAAAGRAETRNDDKASSR